MKFVRSEIMKREAEYRRNNFLITNLEEKSKKMFGYLFNIKYNQVSKQKESFTELFLAQLEIEFEKILNNNTSFRKYNKFFDEVRIAYENDNYLGDRFKENSKSKEFSKFIHLKTLNKLKVDLEKLNEFAENYENMDKNERKECILILEGSLEFLVVINCTLRGIMFYTRNACLASLFNHVLSFYDNYINTIIKILEEHDIINCNDLKALLHDFHEKQSEFFWDLY